jgi:dTMP kinase
MFAARADHVARVIRPALEAGRWVVCDRFTDATFAYQGGGKKVPRVSIEQLAQMTHPGLRPDLTLVFDCAYDVSRGRLARAGRNLDRFEREDQAFFERVRAAYLDLARSEPARMRVIDGSRPLADIKKQLDQIIVAI